ncbi:MAG: 50S ribosomal protein L35 [Desulfohalobiaceae bacterium]|nr:50S ribosomal protein L35 [Desulfohalobiaceae bacterium]
MPKMKSHSGAAKRFRKTGSGKIKRNRAFHSHLLTKKNAKRKRRLRTRTVTHPSNLKAARTAWGK